MNIYSIFFLIPFFLFIFFGSTTASQDKVDKKQQALFSQQTKSCIECHKLYTHGIV
jgi:hypothetical protein